jgi:type II secretory pathway pseudopilin PulG
MWLLMAAAVCGCGVLVYRVRKAELAREEEQRIAGFRQMYDDYDNWQERYHLTPNEYAAKNRISSYYKT